MKSGRKGASGVRRMREPVAEGPRDDAAGANGLADTARANLQKVVGPLLHAVVANAPVILFAVDSDGVVQLSEGRGLSPLRLEPGQLVGAHVKDAFGDQPEVIRMVERAVTGEESCAVLTMNGRTLSTWCGPLRGSDQRILGVIGTATDISADRSSQALQGLQVQVLQGIATGSPLSDVLRSVRRLVELGGDDITCRVIVNGSVTRPQDNTDPWSYPIVTRQGETVGMVVAKPERSRVPTADQRRLLMLAARLAAITFDRDATTRQLDEAAYRDPLTALPNRDRLARELDATLRFGTAQAAVLFCDLDRFKLINDSLGHEYGDRVLAAVAARLRSVVRTDDFVARFGGDEFVVVLSRVKDDTEAKRLTRRILRRITQPLVIDERQLLTTMSIGVVLPVPGSDPMDALRHADAAMYRAKQRGRDTFVMHDPSAERGQALHRLELETDIRAALHQEDLCLHFQPIVRCESGRVASLEALVRWRHPVRGFVSPGEFLPVAKEAGLLPAIDRWVLQEACREIAGLPGNNAGQVPVVSVNISGLRFDEPQMVTRVLAKINSSGLAPEQVIIEVTEGLFAAGETDIISALQELRAHGIRIAVDDFGIGYSSLHRLKTLPVDVLKVDRSFVEDLCEMPEASALLDAIITMGHALGLEIVAEGVETRSQFEEAQRLGCDMAQGFLFARPQSLVDLYAAGPHLDMSQHLE